MTMEEASDNLSTDPIGPGAISLYMYAVGSIFEDILNSYMITGQALHPPDLVQQVANSSWIWIAANGSVETPPLAGVRLLQSLE